MFKIFEIQVSSDEQSLILFGRIEIICPNYWHDFPANLPIFHVSHFAVFLNLRRRDYDRNWTVNPGLWFCGKHNDRGAMQVHTTSDCAQ